MQTHCRHKGSTYALCAKVGNEEVLCPWEGVRNETVTYVIRG